MVNWHGYDRAGLSEHRDGNNQKYPTARQVSIVGHSYMGNTATDPQCVSALHESPGNIFFCATIFQLRVCLYFGYWLPA